ncbi:MAG: hypothetical protein WCJ40_19295, partial [Planctomycetota bacterium]
RARTTNKPRQFQLNNYPPIPLIARARSGCQPHFSFSHPNPEGVTAINHRLQAYDMPPASVENVSVKAAQSIKGQFSVESA